MAEPFTMFTSKVVPIDAENVDTDQIVPARYLKVTDKDGLAEALFRDWRFEEDGSLKDPPFVLDQPGMAGRQDPARRRQLRRRVVARARAVGADAPGASGRSSRRRYADIFRNNSLKNGAAADRRATRRPTSGCGSSSSADPDAQLTIDLAEAGRPAARRLDDRLRRSTRSRSRCCSPGPTSSATSSRRRPSSTPGRRPTRRGSTRSPELR